MLCPACNVILYERVALKDYSKDSTISLASIKSYIENSRIGTMKVMGEYIFFDNYSNICATVVHLLRHMALIGDCDRLVICCNWGNGKVIIRSGCCCYRRSSTFTEPSTNVLPLGSRSWSVKLLPSSKVKPFGWNVTVQSVVEPLPGLRVVCPSFVTHVG